MNKNKYINKQPICILQINRTGKIPKPKITRRKEVIKIKAEFLNK